MKKVKYILFFILLLMPFYVEAFSPSDTDCDLDDVATSGYTFDEISCKNLSIHTNDNLDFLRNQNVQLDSVCLSYNSFYDMSFLENIEVNTLTIFNASVDFRAYLGSVLNIEMNKTYVISDDFSGLKRNKTDFASIKMYDSFAMDFDTFPVTKVKNTILIDKHKYPLANLDSFENYTGKFLVLNGIGYMLDEFVVEALTLNGVIIDGVDTSLIENDREMFELMNDELVNNIDTYDSLNAAVAVMVTDKINNTSTFSDDALHNFVNGYGDSYVYSLMTALVFKALGYEAATVAIERNATSYYYITGYFDDGWHYIDTYYLDQSGEIENVKNGVGSPYLNVQVGLDASDEEYVFEEFFPENFNIPDYIIFQEDESIFNVMLYDDIESLPMPSKEGYNFWGWYFDKEYTNKVEYASYLFPGDMVYARWGVGNPPTSTDDPTDLNPPTSTDDPEEEKNPNIINPPNTGDFIVPIVLILSIVMLFITYIGSKKFKRVFRI